MKAFFVVLAVLASTAYADVCEGEANGAFVDNPDLCPGYFQCIDGVPNPGSCQAPYIFYPVERHCSYAIGECADYWSRTTPAPTTTTAAPLNYECIVGDIHYLPHDKSCSKYILCYNGVPSELECPAGLFFHPTELNCVKEDISQCTENPCPEVDSETPLYFPSNRDCNIYYICLNGAPKEFSCYVNYVFDISINKCNVPEDTDTSHCDGSTGTTSSP